MSSLISLKLEQFRILVSKLKLKYILDPNRSIKRQNIPAPLKSQVWDKYISTEYKKGKCFCCKTTEISCDNFHGCHIISHKDKGKIELDNLRPICSKCNTSMGKRNMYEFINEFGFWN